MPEERGHTEQLKEFDANATVDNPTVVNSVEERLRNLNVLTQKEEVDDSAVSDEELEDSTPDIKDDDSIEDDSQAESDNDTTESTPDDEEGTDISIPEAYIRAAIHRGWKEEIIDDLIKSNPELAQRTLENCYLEVNNASKEWSALGRAKRDQELQEQNATEAISKVTKEDLDVTPTVNKLREAYPDDPFIEGVIKTLENSAKIANAKPQIPVAQEQYQIATKRANIAANAATEQRINNFFSSDIMSPYEKFYGKLELGQSVADLTYGQQQNRMAVLDEAEAILIGHRMRGIDLDPVKALDKAHLIVTEPIREQVIRSNLKTTALKRKKSMTLRPSESKRSSDKVSNKSSKARSKEELEAKVNEKMASIPGLRG